MIEERELPHTKIPSVPLGGIPLDLCQSQEAGKVFEAAQGVAVPKYHFRREIFAQWLHLLEQHREGSQEAVLVEEARLPPRPMFIE